MLSIAFRRQGKSEKALEFARQSLQIYEEMKQYSEVEKVNQLISELMS